MKKLRSEKPQNTEVFKSILDDSMRSRVRARNLNAIEEDRLQKMNKIIEKERRHRENVRSRVLQRTEKTFKEKNALQKVLSKNYRVDNFMTMQRGFKRPLYQPPREARRFKVETRIYHSGFGVRALRPEINKEMRQVDPDTVHRIIQKVLAEKCLEVNDVPVERTLPDSEMYQNLFDRAMQTDRTIRKRNDVLYHSLRDVTPSPRTSRAAIFKTSDYAQTPVRLKSGNITDSTYRNLYEKPEISVIPKPKPDTEPDYESSIQEVSVSQQLNKGTDRHGGIKTKVSVRPISHSDGDNGLSVSEVSIRPINEMNSVNKSHPSYTFSQTHGINNGGHNSLKLPALPNSSRGNNIHKIIEEADDSFFSDNEKEIYNKNSMPDMSFDEDGQIDIEDNTEHVSNVDQTHQTPANDNKLQFISELLDDDHNESGGYSPNNRGGKNNHDVIQKSVSLDRTPSANSLRSSQDQWQFKTTDSDDNGSPMYQS